MKEENEYRRRSAYVFFSSLRSKRKDSPLPAMFSFPLHFLPAVKPPFTTQTFQKFPRC